MFDSHWVVEALMIGTEYFLQLCPTPVWRIRNQYRHYERKHLPISLQFLIDSGIDSKRVEPLIEMANHDRVTEMMLVSVIMLRLFAGESLHARTGIDAWLRRKGGCPKAIEEAADHFAQELLNEEACPDPELRVKERVIREQERMVSAQSLLASVNDGEMRICKKCV